VGLSDEYERNLLGMRLLTESMNPVIDIDVRMVGLLLGLSAEYERNLRVLPVGLSEEYERTLRLGDELPELTEPALGLLDALLDLWRILRTSSSTTSATNRLCNSCARVTALLGASVDDSGSKPEHFLLILMNSSSMRSISSTMSSACSSRIIVFLNL